MLYFFKRFLLTLFLPLSLLGNPTQNRDPIDLSMVISGGVSLGAYEAGYNWAMVKMLTSIRDHNPNVNPQLRSVTGASAGSINALLTAIYWCQKPEIQDNNSIENNLFYNTWAKLGLKDLIINGEDPNNKSTLFSRKKLRISAKEILKHMDRSIYTEGCEIPLGFSVTKAKAITTEFQETGIKIKNQHFSVPLTLKSKNNRLSLSNRAMPPSSDYYIQIPHIENDTSKVIDVLFASSAFPGAFQQIKLNYIYEGVERNSYFIDGGAYDNLPLQLAIELDKRAKDFIFIDPSNIRGEEENLSQEEEQPPIGFLSSNALPLLDSLEIFQSMRLYNAINQYFYKGSSNRLILSSRYHPLTGKFLSHFGAFFDEDFRVYDYHVGVYDAVYHLASAMQKRGYKKELQQPELMHQLKTSLGIKEHSSADTAYKLFLQTEFHPEIPVVIKDKFSAIYRAFALEKKDTQRYELDDFQMFLAKLNQRYLHDKNSFIPKNEDELPHWYKKPLQLLIKRITTLENNYAEVQGNSKLSSNLTNMLAWLTSNFTKEKNGFHLLPMNIPEDADDTILANALRLLPSEITTDIKNGGIGAGYNIYTYQDRKSSYAYESRLSFNQSDDSDNFLRIDINMFRRYKSFLKVGGGASLFGNMQGTFYQKESFYGLNTYISILDIFRLSYVHRFGNINNNNNSYIYFGVENLPSLIYWLQ